jgi:signal transduction histidine kinase
MARLSQRVRTGHTILVVDDEEEVLQSLRTILEREGHRVLTANSGERALVLLKENDIHLILLDYIMPRMNGARLVREIRAFDSHVQIILQTGYAGGQPPTVMLEELDIQGYHDKADGPEKLLLWVAAGLKAYRLIRGLKERERVQAELVANVSHELRTPLNIILGYAELLLDSEFCPIPEPAVSPLRSLASATRNLTSLVSDFLQYAKVDAGASETNEVPVSTSELGQELQRLGSLLLEDRDVAFQVDTEAAPAELLTDALKLRTILRNLVTNAAKFTAAGAITVRITHEDEAVRFTVEDTGPGIHHEDAEVIFEPFRQLDSSSTRIHGGIGLGLALSRKYARLLGGDLTLKSTPDVGSTFTLTMPAKVVARRAGEGRPSSTDSVRVAA